MKTSLKLISTLVLLLTTVSTKAEVRLPAMVSDGMVLQRNADLKIWGWANPGEALTLKFNGKKYRTKADTEGQWEIMLKPMKAGGPFTMEIDANNRIVIRDILIGDVWLCAGQSNMDHYLGRHTERYAREIANSENSQIRQLLVPKNGPMDGPAQDADMQWVSARPESILDFTVVGYFFALKLYDEYQVPIGIIKASVGGTKIEAWTSEEGLKDFPELMTIIEKNKDTAYVNGLNREAEADQKAKAPKKVYDKGLLSDPKWYEPEYTPGKLKPINIPGYWEDQGVYELDGVVWYRREVNVPVSMTGVEALVKLGRITDADELYINGTFIGKTTYTYPQRRYTLPAGVLKPGINLFVVRVVNHSGKGGFIPDKPYFLLAGSDTIDLKGTWDYQVGEVYPKVKFKQGIRGQDQPSALYNGMIAPLTPYAIRGAIWYQGESNASDPDSYGSLLPNLIRDWRAQFRHEDMPFIIAQLPNYMAVDFCPAESGWAEMREVQLQTSRNTPNTGLGINIDLGEWNDIHPGNKKPVGDRLALQAMEISYGKTDFVSSGPIYRSHQKEGKKIFLSFDYVGSGLKSGDGEELAHFALAGEDGVFRWAKALIEDDKVVVWCEEISNPLYLRYAWANNPDFANLYNKEGLPASPFRITID